MPDDPFFVVWNPAHGLPRFRHDRAEDAIAEAERLARENRGQKFYVLSSVGFQQSNDVTWTPLDTDPIPF